MLEEKAIHDVKSSFEWEIDEIYRKSFLNNMNLFDAKYKTMKGSERGGRERLESLF